MRFSFLRSFIITTVTVVFSCLAVNAATLTEKVAAGKIKALALLQQFRGVTQVKMVNLWVL